MSLMYVLSYLSFLFLTKNQNTNQKVLLNFWYRLIVHLFQTQVCLFLGVLVFKQINMKRIGWTNLPPKTQRVSASRFEFWKSLTNRGRIHLLNWLIEITKFFFCQQQYLSFRLKLSKIVHHCCCSYTFMAVASFCYCFVNIVIFRNC